MSKFQTDRRRTVFTTKKGNKIIVSVDMSGCWHKSYIRTIKDVFKSKLDFLNSDLQFWSDNGNKWDKDDKLDIIPLLKYVNDTKRTYDCKVRKLAKLIDTAQVIHYEDETSYKDITLDELLDTEPPVTHCWGKCWCKEYPREGLQ